MSARRLLEQERTDSIIGGFYAAYNALGYGFLEHVYSAALERELRSRGHRVAREAFVRIMYKGEELVSQRLDMIVDECIVIEIKATQSVHESASRQLYNYLKATNLTVGLLFHFGPRPAFWLIVGDVARSDQAHPNHPAHPC